MFSWRTIAALIFGMVSVTETWAGPPFLTDDPEIPPPNNWEINVPFTLDRTKAETDMETPLFDINYGTPAVFGLGRVQLELDIPVEVVSKADAATTAGLGDILVGVKWPFCEERGWRPMMAIYPQVLTPTGERSRGLGAGRAAYILPVLAEKNWDKWQVYGNVGYVVQTAAGDHNYWYEGVCLNREITKRLELGGEITENSLPPADGYSNLLFNLGGTWTMTEHFNLLFTAGRSIHGDTQFMAYLGIQMLLGGTNK